MHKDPVEICLEVAWCRQSGVVRLLKQSQIHHDHNSGYLLRITSGDRDRFGENSGIQWLADLALTAALEDHHVLRGHNERTTARRANGFDCLSPKRATAIFARGLPAGFGSS